MLELVWPRMAANAYVTSSLRAGGRRLMLAGGAVLLASLMALAWEPLAALTARALPALQEVAVALLQLHLWVSEPRQALFIVGASLVAVLTIHVRNAAMMTGLVMAKAKASDAGLSAEELRAAAALFRANTRVCQWWGVGILGGSLLLVVLAIPGRLVLDMPPSESATVIGIVAVGITLFALVSPVFSWLLPLDASLRLDLQRAYGGVSGNLRYSVWSESGWSLEDRTAILLYLLADRAGQTKELRKLIGELDA